MSPSKLHNSNKDLLYNRVPPPPPLKIQKNSHYSIKRSSPSPPSSSSSSSVPRPPRPPPTQRRHPVIIYTHSPKVIHTQPKDFRNLVQRLTGLTRPKGASGKDAPPSPDPERNDTSSSSVVTEEHGVSSSSCSVTNDVIRDDNHGGLTTTDSCHTSERLNLNPPDLMNIPGDFFCPNQLYYHYGDPLLFRDPNSGMRPREVTSSPSMALLERSNQFREH